VTILTVTPTVNIKSGIYTIQSLNNNSYVNINNGNLTTSSTQNGNFTQWTIESVDAANKLYSICNVGMTTNSCLSLVGNNGVSLSKYVSIADGGNNAQSWAINQLADGTYEIVSSWGTYLNPLNGTPPGNGQGPYLNLYINGSLGLWVKGSSAQKWIIKPV